MKIREQEVQHSPASMQIVEHRSCKAPNRASRPFSHYLVNADRRVLAEYRSAERSPGQFAFVLEGLGALPTAFGGGEVSCMVWGHVAVCAFIARIKWLEPIS